MFSIQYIGCCTEHHGSFCVDHPQGLGSYLLLHTRSRGHYCIHGTEMTVEPNAFVLLRPQTPHTYRDIDGYYADDWIHFASTDPVPDRLCDRPIPIGGVVQVDLYIRLIRDAHLRGAGSRLISQLIQTMLDDVCSLLDAPSPLSAHAAPLLALRKRIYEEPQQPWTIQRMATQLMLSASHFQALYKHTFGISPVADVIASRIETAKKYLLSSNLNISEIAERCGYSSAVHFTRQFHAQLGKAPSAFRADRA